MEDIEDLLIGSGGGAPPGFRLPLTSVGLNPKRNRKRNQAANLAHKHSENQHSASPKIPGTQTIYMKTFGCSHNQSDSEYMAGQLSAFGYTLSDTSEEADLWLINTGKKWTSQKSMKGSLICLYIIFKRMSLQCFPVLVKSPSQSAMETIIARGKSSNKPLVVAGCVPQGSRDLKELEGISIVGVQQIDRVVEVVEETLKGHEVRLLTRKTLPALDLPKVRKNKFVEILPINVGCLGACTYCKTKHARGHLGSYTIESLVARVKSVVADGVKEIWLSSEDTGAYGRDIGVNLPTLLNALVAELPADASTMLRVGMTNPPFILEHLKEIAEVLRHSCVYSFLHVPVQSGSDSILSAMNREYTVSEFRTVVDTLTALVPGMQIATDIICGFPGETVEDFAQTVSLIEEYKFPQVHISQFYPRPGTPAARMKKVPSNVVKNRSRELTSVFEAFMPYTGMEGKVERIWITDIASDGIHLVGHTKGYIQVLVDAPVYMLGTSAMVKIASVGRWSVFGKVIETIKHINDNRASSNEMPNQENSSLSFNPTKAGGCLEEQESFACELDSCCGQSNLEKSDISRDAAESCACGLEDCCGQSNPKKSDISRDTALRQNQNSRHFFGWTLRKRKHLHGRVESELTLGTTRKLEENHRSTRDWNVVDKALLGGIFISILTIITLIAALMFRVTWIQ